MLLLAKGYASNQTNNAMKNIMIVVFEPLDVIYVCPGKLDFEKRWRVFNINFVELLTAWKNVWMRKNTNYMNKKNWSF